MSYAAFAGLSCAIPRVRSGLAGFAQTPATTVRDVRVVVKSFIRCIGSSVGSLPSWCPIGSSLRLRAMAFATDRMMCENPMHDRKDKGYRLFSACTFRVTCQAGRVVDVTASALDTDTGKEGPLQAPPLITTPVRVVRTADGFEFSWFARGRPHLAAEPPFQLVCPRTSVFIWHRVSGRVRCTPDGTDVSVNLTGSKFPTHRVFVNGTAMHTVPQGGFSRLWFPVSITEPTRVEGVPGGGSVGVLPPDGGAGVAGIPPAPASSATPAFRFTCAPGCAPLAANQCQAIVRRAVREAIGLAENAAAKLEARDTEALRLFRAFFGDPSRPVPWANNQQAADLVAFRFRAVARGFRTRVPHIRCATAADACGAAAAFVVPRAAPSALIPLPRNTIILCPPFWSTASAAARAAMLLHEMLHLLFWEFFGHQENLPRPGDPEERRRDNSYCYHVFALRLAGHGASQFWRSRCTDRPF